MYFSTLTRAYLRAELKQKARELACALQRLYENTKLTDTVWASQVIALTAMCETFLILKDWKSLNKSLT